MNSLKKYKLLLELVNKEETENGAIDLLKSCKIMKDFWSLAKKHGFDCYVKWYPKDVFNYEPTGKTYEIKTVQDIAQLSPEQFEMFIEDLRNWCNMERMIKVFRDIGVATSPEWITWIDSWLHETTVKCLGNAVTVSVIKNIFIKLS